MLDKTTVVCVIARFSLCGLFFWAAIGKLLGQNTGTMYGEIVTDHSFIASALVTLEILLGAWLLSGLVPRHAAAVSVVVLACFGGAIAAEMTKNHPLPCGCMGATEKLYDPIEIRHELSFSLFRNCLSIVPAVGLMLGSKRGEVKRADQKRCQDS